MREKHQKQMPLMPQDIDHPRARELARISDILDSLPIINQMVLQDLTKGQSTDARGACGMSAEQVLRAAILKQSENLTYEQLAFHLMDSRTYRNFCRIGITDKGFQRSTLCKNIKAISHRTWESINRLLTAHVQDQGIEKGQEARVDCTVVCTNIHHPSDSALLWDAVRVLNRLLHRTREKLGIALAFSDHCRRAKKRMQGILNAKKQKARVKLYKDLLRVTEQTYRYAGAAVSALQSFQTQDPVKASMAQALLDDFRGLLPLVEGVMDQTRRRVLAGEKVPASEKVVSLFEPHTDIIVKDRRDTYYGHKVCLSTGKSNLITDCLIVEGNPADSMLTVQMLDRHDQIFGHYPLKAALDGGFASKENLHAAKGRGVKDVCFAKKRGLKEEDMCRSAWMYKKLRRFRAGIESSISWLKRCFGLWRCTWKSFESFKSYVWVSVVSANLFTLAREARMAKA